MPGPVSDSYDPEFSTGANRDQVRDELKAAYDRLTKLLGGRPPMFILDVLRLTSKRPRPRYPFSERELRLLRFALERALESL